MLIGVSGKINSGKDTVGKIANIILSAPHFTDEAVESLLPKEVYNQKYKIKKFADKLKDIVCLLIGCTREQLEDREFKEKELEEEWWYYKALYPSDNNRLVQYEGNLSKATSQHWTLIKLTPRLLLQLLGTEAGREIIHPNIWVNALMSEYKPVDRRTIQDPDDSNISLPNWIITDMRFPNEVKAVKDKGGITIRINRNKKPIRCNNCMNTYEEDDLINIGEDYVPSCPKCNTDNYLMEDYIDIEHESEKALDNAEFDYVINNNGSMLELIQKVREILIKEKLCNIVKDS